MKKITFTLIAFVFSITAFAQKTLPEIKSGTILQASVFVQGQEYPLLMTVKSLVTPVSLAWSVDGYGDGSFLMTEKGLESGTTLFTGQPGLGESKLADTETWGLISKTAYRTLVDTKAVTYNGIKFKVKTPDASPMKMGGKELDATHIISEDGKLELWILNNAAFPLIVQSAGLPIDFLVTNIK